jgi:hypothetical protein
MVVIFGCQKDKDIEGMIRRIQLGADKVIFTTSGSPRSAEPAELAAQYIEHSGKMAQVGKTLDDAMKTIRAGFGDHLKRPVREISRADCRAPTGVAGNGADDGARGCAA